MRQVECGVRWRTGWFLPGVELRVRDNVAGLRGSPLSSPGPSTGVSMQQEWELFQNCNKKKKKKQKTTTAFCCRKAGCCCRTRAGKHNEQSYSHTKRTVQIFMIMDQISRVDVGAKNKKQKKKHRWFICSYCSKMCAAPEEGDKDTHLTSDCTLMSSSSISAHTMKTGIQCGKKLRPFT